MPAKTQVAVVQRSDMEDEKNTQMIYGCSMYVRGSPVLNANGICRAHTQTAFAEHISSGDITSQSTHVVK